MSHTLFRLLAALFVTVVVVPAQAPNYTLRVDVPFVSVDINVEDTEGKPVYGLSPDAFELYENGVRQQIRYFLPVSTAYNVLLLFDRSGSTQDKWPLMQRAVAGFITNLRPQDRIAIAAFDYELQKQQDWTADRQQALLTLPRLVRGKNIGGTDFYGAVERTLHSEFRKTAGRRALVVLTDGRDTSFYKQVVGKNFVPEPKDDRPFQAALKMARTQRIPVYLVAFNTDMNLEPNTTGGDEYRSLGVIFPNSKIPNLYLTGVRARMEQLAEASGGRILYPQRLEDIVLLYQQIGRELGTAYSLGYVPSNGAADGAFRRIEVRTRAGFRLQQSRNGYYAR